MAEVNFQPRGDIKVIMGSGAKALGTAHEADDTWDALQVVDFNIEHASAPKPTRAPQSFVVGEDPHGRVQPHQ